MLSAMLAIISAILVVVTIDASSLDLRGVALLSAFFSVICGIGSIAVFINDWFAQIEEKILNSKPSSTPEPQTTEEITFKSLSKDIQKALELLKKAGEKAIEGVGSYSVLDDPISKGYGIRTGARWTQVAEGEIITLENAGWNEITYNSFMEWYCVKLDNGCLRLTQEQRKIISARGNFLKKYLSQ